MERKDTIYLGELYHCSQPNAYLRAECGIEEFLSYCKSEKYHQIWSERFHKAQLFECDGNSTIFKRKLEDPATAQGMLHGLFHSGSNMNLGNVVSIQGDHGHIVITYSIPKYTVHDVLTYSPAVFERSYCHLQFVMYQMLRCQHYLHSNGFLLGSISLKDVYVDENLWLQICPKFQTLRVPPSQPNGKFDSISKTSSSDAVTSDAVTSDAVTSDAVTSDAVTSDAVIEHVVTVDALDLRSAMERWVEGSLTNFDYLMIINRLCGRELGNPNHHPVFPWIMDFSQPLGGWRDFTKTKFRLNKGDDQLDQTYKIAQLSSHGDDLSVDLGPLAVPHHISDVLSDITYYTYKARVTDKQLLCKYVRQKWVPHEYPSSIMRMQEWTPDECIPEFFTDASIFKSMHTDLPDLEVPSWAKSVDDFISQHRSALESDFVSEKLHHWIDLTFGYKLSGEAAVQHKNVCLELVDGHTEFTDHGIVQLFTSPHPQRACKPTKYVSPNAPHIHPKNIRPAFTIETKSDSTEIEGLIEEVNKLSNEPILLPPDFDPMELLDREELTHSHRDITNQKQKCDCRDCPYRTDTLHLGCLFARIVLPVETRIIADGGNRAFKDYLGEMQDLVWSRRHSLPSQLYCILERALEIPTRHTLNQQAVGHSDCLPPVKPALLLAPSVLPLPRYFEKLYAVIELHHKMARQSLTNKKSSDDLDSLHRDQLNSHLRFVSDELIAMSVDSWELYLPYVKLLLSQRDSDHCIRSVWYLFGQLSQVLDLTGSQQHLSPLIVQLYEKGDLSATSKLKLYHSVFLLQLQMQLGLQHFLDTFIQPLVHSLCSVNSTIAQSSRGDGKKLGPLLSAKFVTDRLLRHMKDCYNGRSPLTQLSDELDHKLFSILTSGDTQLLPVIHCLEEIAFIYGEQYILLHYIPYISHMVDSSDTAEVNASSGRSLLAVCSLLIHLIPCLSDKTLLDHLKIKIVHEIIRPMLVITSCPCTIFRDDAHGGTAIRRLLTFRLLNLIDMIGQRVGFDQTRRFLKATFRAFFRSFDIVHLPNGVWMRTKTEAVAVSDSNEFLDVKQSAVDKNDYFIGTPEKLGMSPSPDTVNEVSRNEVSAEVLEQLQQVFTPELAHRAYIQCCKLAGGMFLAKIINDDLIRHLSSQYEQQLQHIDDSDVLHSPLVADSSKHLFGSGSNSTNWFIPVPSGPSATTQEETCSSSPSISGNRLAFVNPNETSTKDKLPLDIPNPFDKNTGYPAIPTEKLRRSEMEAEAMRHLKGDWVAYWEHELGRRQQDHDFQFKQINLQLFSGHTAAVRHIHPLGNENSFISCSKDKTVRLWTLRNTGNGTARCSAQFTYTNHRRTVFYGTYLNSVKKIVTCDGVIHLWDPQTGSCVVQYELGKNGGVVTAVQSLGHPYSNYLIAATSESTLRFIDIRSNRLAHVYRTTSSAQLQLGFIRGITVGDNWIAVAHSAGLVSSLELRTGSHLACWMYKGIEGEIQQMLTYGRTQIVLTSSDGQFGWWKYDSPHPLCQMKLSSEQHLHTLRQFDSSVISASGANRISVHEPDPYSAIIHSSPSTKLRNDMFRGNLSTLAVLPMNRQLLLGSDSGTVHLMA